MPRRPNLLLLYTDQQRFDTIAALGNPYIQTPVLDSVVAEGTSFTSAYCPSPVCVASRCSLLLSQYPHQTGCVANMPMPQERTSLMEVLADAGYQTWGVGKMHFSPNARKMWGFQARVFAEEGGMREGDDYCDFLREHGFGHIADTYGVRSDMYYVPQPSQVPEHLHSSYFVADKSLEFLANRDRERPFFLWASFTKPHPPFESPVPWNRLYKSVEMPLPFVPQDYEDLLTFWNRVQNRYKYRDQGFDWNLIRLIRAQYYASISFVDYNVGRILSYLREEGELDNTLIVFTADHGELLGDYGSFGKRCILDPAARVPLLVRYPERFEAGVQCEEAVSSIDILPTMLAAADITPSLDRVGLDLAEFAAGRADRDGVICQFQEGPIGVYGLITRQWKYFYSAPDNKEWLLRRVPGKMDERNCAGNPAYAEVQKTLRDRLIQRFRGDGYEVPLEEDHWRVFPKREVPDTPDAWLLFQEGADVSDRFPEGYSPRIKPHGGVPVQGI
ncbi:MAG: sulfatase-like hydrolase/transferase [Armatimonadetes bacterium]|nr:sulfatase-like hydrolase/transferase [Armatimonadota bacterium]